MPRQRSGIFGIDKVISNLQHELKQIEVKSLAGMIEAAAFIRKDMEDNDPKIPVDTGNLRKSWFVKTVKGIQKGVIMGFNANYAIYVHEMVDRNFKRPGSGAKFLEKALYRNKQRILEIIKSKSKI